MAEDATDNNNKHPVTLERDTSRESSGHAHQRNASIASTSKDNKHHDSEPNPFERSFSGTAGHDASKQVLPGVDNLTSPAHSSQTGMPPAPGWSPFGSLRNGPLSPAMLLGPSGLGGFDCTLRTGLTPNESSIRTGLTPKGDSWANLNSPGALFNHFGSGLTPGGNLNFLSGGPGNPMNDSFARPLPPSHLGQDNGLVNDNMSGNIVGQDADAAANGLFLLSQHAQPGQHHNQDDLMRQATVNRAKNAGNLPIKNEDYDVSPTANRKGRRASSNGNSHSPDESKPVKRGKKNATLPPPAPLSDSGNDSDGNMDLKDDKNETDEQKRKNFLERNRQAALKCRQRKKQWLQNLQAKVEYYGQENDQLTNQVANLRDELVSLKTMLLAHKDCPVARGMNMGGNADMQHMQQSLQY